LLPRSLREPAAIETTGVSIGRHDFEQRGAVLLVEDDREVAALARELIVSLGYSVTHVASAEAALGALANSRQIDLVLSDIMMPGGVSGLELAREIRKRHPHLPIVLTTGYVESAAGMHEKEFRLLLKPFTLETLADALLVDAKPVGR
jgi:CheY-like chemotaxis protein